MAERYTVTDVEGLAAHLATVLARFADGHANATAVANAALGWAVDHGYIRTERRTEAECPRCLRDVPLDGAGALSWHRLSDGMFCPSSKTWPRPDGGGR